MRISASDIQNESLISNFKNNIIKHKKKELFNEW